jgi:hypothetical protein
VLKFCFIHCVIGLNIFEIVIQNGLLKRLTDHDIVSKEQYGVRIKLKTDNATYQLTSKILNVFCNILLIGGIFWDLQKAILMTGLECIVV